MFGKDVLVVDDDKLICWGLEKLISSRNLRVTTVMNGKDAIFEIYNVPYNSVFLDINLPDISGIDVLYEIKKVAPDTKVVIMTAEDTHENRQQAMAGGAFQLIKKPFNVPDIENVLEGIFSADRA